MIANKEEDLVTGDYEGCWTPDEFSVPAPPSISMEYFSNHKCIGLSRFNIACVIHAIKVKGKVSFISGYYEGVCIFLLGTIIDTIQGSISP